MELESSVPLETFEDWRMYLLLLFLPKALAVRIVTPVQQEKFDQYRLGTIEETEIHFEWRRLRVVSRSYLTPDRAAEIKADGYELGVDDED